MRAQGHFLQDTKNFLHVFIARHFRFHTTHFGVARVLYNCDTKQASSNPNHVCPTGLLHYPCYGWAGGTVFLTRKGVSGFGASSAMAHPRTEGPKAQKWPVSMDDWLGHPSGTLFVSPRGAMPRPASGVGESRLAPRLAHCRGGAEDRGAAGSGTVSPRLACHGLASASAHPAAGPDRPPHPRWTCVRSWANLN